MTKHFCIFSLALNLDFDFPLNGFQVIFSPYCATASNMCFVSAGCSTSLTLHHICIEWNIQNRGAIVLLQRIENISLWFSRMHLACFENSLHWIWIKLSCTTWIHKGDSLRPLPITWAFILSKILRISQTGAMHTGHTNIILSKRGTTNKAQHYHPYTEPCNCSPAGSLTLQIDCTELPFSKTNCTNPNENNP